MYLKEDELISVFIPGNPIAQPRHRVSVRFGKAHAYLPASHKVHGWKSIIWLYCSNNKLSNLNITKPVKIDLTFFMPIPKSLKNKITSMQPHIKKPDIDNLVKAVLDSMTDCHVWQDDSLVYDIASRKFYSDAPGVLIKLKEGTP